MKLLVGTSGYSYKEWKGNFYPDDLPAAGMLRFYAQRFQTVEINNTFYQMPAVTTLERWATEVPKEFVFVLKASRRITHDNRLKDTEDSLAYLLKTAAVLDKHLGPLLFQLPPFFKKDLPRLRDFLTLLPKERPAAFEFRHASWFDDEIYDTLRAHGAALCIADTDDDEQVPLVATASWGYLRLRRQNYGDKDLARWAKQIQDQPWNQSFVFFKHEEEGKGPKLAARFLELATDQKSEVRS
jgi:uncharacterized protein YecE (DUF72 family)